MRKPPKFLLHLLSVYSANALNGILGVIAVPLVVSVLGGERYGIYSIYAVLASYIALIDCGVTKHFIRLMSSATHPEGKTDFLRKAFGWYLFLALVLAGSLPLLVFLVTRYLFPVPTEYLSQVRWIVILAVIEYVLTIPLMLTQAYTMANLGFGRYSNFIAISGFLRYFLMFLGAWMYKSPVMVVLFLVARRIFELFGARFILLMPPRNAWRPRINILEFFQVLKASSVMSLAQFLQTTVVSIGSVLLNRHFGVAVLGNYRAAFDLSSKVWFFSNGIGLVVFPKFSQILSNTGEREGLLVKMMLWLEKSWVGYLLIAIMAICGAPALLPLIQLGDEQILHFFMLLILGICLNAHTNVSYEYLLADSRYQSVAFLSFGVLIIMYLSYLFLIGSAGPYAIGWAWIVSQAAYALVADELVVRKKGSVFRNEWRQLLTKVLLLLVTVIFLWIGFISAIHTMMLIAPFIILTGVIFIVKDIEKLRSLFVE